MNPISVMLVDDNSVFLRVATQFLEAHDGVVVVGTAGGGEEALARVKDLQPQVILIDLAMPDLPGLQAIPRLRSALPEASIVALTAMNTKGFRRAALDAGADVFIPKVAMRADLLPAIRRLVQAGREEVAKLESFPDESTTASRRILVMEDDDHLRSIFSRALRAVGYEVHPAGTVQQARDLLTQARFDVLLCDIQMGRERGTDFLREHATTLFTSGAQVIVVSGHAQYRDVCQEMGADFFLEKPVAIGTLTTLVDRLTLQR
jgi:CheY-like chemotaxis protein